MIKYVDEIICFQEVPDETALSFSISNCPRGCVGCHSSYLSGDIGRPLKSRLTSAIEANKGLITCVLFLGGDDEAQVTELKECLDICRQYGLKTALYSGADVFPECLAPYLDYIKFGHYDENKGGLTSPTTNQKFLKRLDGEWVDITSHFWGRSDLSSKEVEEYKNDKHKD